MKREVKLLPKAASDIANAQFFYESQATDLGKYFRDAINADMRALLGSAGVHRVVHGLHHCPSKRFPFAIFYRVEGEVVLIYAVLDSRRDPGKLEHILSER